MILKSIFALSLVLIANFAFGEDVNIQKVDLKVGQTLEFPSGNGRVSVSCSEIEKPLCKISLDVWSNDHGHEEGQYLVFLGEEEKGSYHYRGYFGHGSVAEDKKQKLDAYEKAISQVRSLAAQGRCQSDL